tara:strand:- start:3127 stop:3396 length:270 start_codon:yes stop_codon:yes gene_type:complete
MGDDSNCGTFQSRVQKLRSLREKLCDQTAEWTEAFEIRDFVMNELQEMHLKLKEDSGVTTEWCKEKVERILHRMCALPEIDTTSGENNA